MSEVRQPLSLAQVPSSRALAFVSSHGTTILVAAVVFLVAYDRGGYGEPTRDTLAIGLWWMLILGLGLGVLPLVRTPLAALLTGGLLAAFGLLALLSTVWAADSAGAYAEFTRVALYLAVFTAAVVASTRDNAGNLVDGLALGLVAVSVVALVSRLFPGTFGGDELPRLLSAGGTRLTFPVGYWNGLAILVALAIPLLLRLALVGRDLFVRGLALAPVPAIAATIYLTSSRVGIAAAVLGTVVFLLLTARRWAALGAIVVSAIGSAVVLVALLGRNELVNGPLNSAAAAGQGRSAALIIAVVCILTGLAFGLARKLVPAARPHPAAGWVLLALAVAATAGAVAAVHPVRQFEAFKHVPEYVTRGTVQGHLLSGAGNGRWQLWAAAIREFESKPLLGRGAGSYEAWWLQHGSLPLYVQNAHSLYVETLGELGIVGFCLLAGTFLTGLAAATVRLRHLAEATRVTLAAVTAGFVAYAVAAATDWIWELTIVSVVGFACLGLAVGPATADMTQPRARRSEPSPRRTRLGRYGLAAAVIVAGSLLVCAIAVQLVAGVRLSDSRAAVARNDLPGAVAEALDARSIQPWASEPYVQLALVEERAGNYRTARSWIGQAISRNRSDWRAWLIRARVETELGEIPAAAKSLQRARSLNPQSRLLAGS